MRLAGYGVHFCTSTTREGKARPSGAQANLDYRVNSGPTCATQDPASIQPHPPNGEGSRVCIIGVSPQEQQKPGSWRPGCDYDSKSDVLRVKQKWLLRIFGMAMSIIQHTHQDPDIKRDTEGYFMKTRRSFIRKA